MRLEETEPMDTAVALVQTYLQVNGYFTVAEYPILETLSPNQSRTVTDIDILALRFPGAGPSMTGNLSQPNRIFSADPILKASQEMPDMLLGEVKEGRAQFNSAMRDPDVLAVALARFGCCPPDHSRDTAHDLLKHGQARTHSGHAVRLVTFGSSQDFRHPRALSIPLQHVIKFLQDYLHSHWEAVRHAQFKDSVLGLFALMEKAKGI